MRLPHCIIVVLGFLASIGTAAVAELPDTAKTQAAQFEAPSRGDGDRRGCRAPFDGRSFGLDAMAGGTPLSGFNRFTLYTPNSAAIIQRFLESKAVFDASSPTGFSKWNAATTRMEPYNHRIDIGSGTTAPIKDLSEASLVALLAGHDQAIAPVTAKLSFTVNGIPVSPAPSAPTSVRLASGASR